MIDRTVQAASGMFTIVGEVQETRPVHELRRRVEYVAHQVGLDHDTGVKARFPTALPGGQGNSVGVARELAVDPLVRGRLQEELFELRKSLVDDRLTHQ